MLRAALVPTANLEHRAAWHTRGPVRIFPAIKMAFGRTRQHVHVCRGLRAKNRREALGTHGKQRGFAAPRAAVGRTLRAHRHTAKVDSHGRCIVVADHRAWQDIVVAHELRGEPAAWTIEKIFGRAALFNASAPHEDNAVAHGERFFLAMRDVDERHAERLVNLHELGLHVVAQAFIEGAERFIE